MFTNKPTDTNWTVSESEEGSLLIKHLPGDVIAEIEPLESAREYADVIAAAPDMLAALTYAVEEYYANDYCGAPDAPAAPEWVREAESAIAKAKGES